ncbi:MAG: hypothetical protein E7169_01625 [Firmicutes bacterium]|nr:hypothetical protein [Bacillota bacterium]
MNYFNPYFSALPYSYTPTVSTSKGLLSGLFSGGKLSSIINGTQKTLGIVNQAIPLVQQLSPIMKNAKTMFKVMNEFKKVEPVTNNKNQAILNNNNISENVEKIEVITKKEQTSNNFGPTFFL